MVKKFVFVTGPSESGKSGACEYMENNFKNVKHLKMRDVIKAANINDDSKSKFWEEYIREAIDMSEEKEIIIMDTLRKPESAIILHRLLGERMSILYIEASLKNRVVREYIKLGKEGKNTSIEGVKERTRKKDIEKNRAGLKQIRVLKKGINGELEIDENGPSYAYIINNDGTIEELHEKLVSFIHEIERKDKGNNER